MARHSTEQSEESVLGPGSRVVGRVSGRGSVRIEGTVRGDVLVGGTAELAEGGTIEGNVQAEGVDVSGSLQGDVSARGPIAIHGSAVVRGELKGSEVSIEPGARVSVRVQTDFELDLGNPRRR